MRPPFAAPWSSSDIQVLSSLAGTCPGTSGSTDGPVPLPESANRDGPEGHEHGD